VDHARTRPHGAGRLRLGDPELHRPACRVPVRATDIEGSKAEVPETRGLRAIVHGFFLLERFDAEAVALQLPLFDALYRYCRERVSKGAAPDAG
jgi:hypothetical protein